jgi:hypothetical protein
MLAFLEWLPANCFLQPLAEPFAALTLKGLQGVHHSKIDPMPCYAGRPCCVLLQLHVDTTLRQLLLQAKTLCSFPCCVQQLRHGGLVIRPYHWHIASPNLTAHACNLEDSKTVFEPACTSFQFLCGCLAYYSGAWWQLSKRIAWC